MERLPNATTFLHEKNPVILGCITLQIRVRQKLLRYTLHIT